MNNGIRLYHKNGKPLSDKQMKIILDNPNAPFSWLIRLFEKYPIRDKGYVYLLENEFGKVKIGKATNPKQRLRSLEIQGNISVKRTYISHLIENYGKIESSMLKKFKSKRLKGEWVDVPFEELKDALETFADHMGKMTIETPKALT